MAYDIAVAIGCEMFPHDEMVRGVGGAGVMLSGITNLRVCIGGVAKLVEFKVSPGIEGFAFMGLKEMKRWGMVIDAKKETVVFRDKCVPFFQTKAHVVLCSPWK